MHVLYSEFSGDKVSPLLIFSNTGMNILFSLRGSAGERADDFLLPARAPLPLSGCAGTNSGEGAGTEGAPRGRCFQKRVCFSSDRPLSPGLAGRGTGGGAFPEDQLCLNGSVCWKLFSIKNFS